MRNPLFRFFPVFCFAVAAGALARPCAAENIIFPRVKAGISDASGIVDVSLPPYNVDRTGTTDVTALLQKALDDNKKWTSVYLPNGTYRVSKTLFISPACVTGGSGDCGVSAPIIQGQSRAGTVIRLAPGVFTSAASPKPVLFSGDGVAQIFRRGIHNLTVLVGANNPGANGVRWFSNNTGLMSEVNVLCEDGAANIGVDLAGGEQEPCAMRDIYIKGFGTGCRCNALNSVTILNLTIENSRMYGVLNENNPLYIDHLTGNNNLVAVRNTGSLTLIDVQLTGGTSAKSAIENTGLLFARNVNAAGYQKALTTSGRAGPSGLSFAEYASNQVSQFPSPTHSMNLPSGPIPDVPWEQDTTKWGNIWVNKGGIGTTPKSDSASLQSLIDNPNLTTICIPFGRTFQIDGDIYIRGNIRRIAGTGGSLIGTGRLVITPDCRQPVLKVEKIVGLQIVNQSDKTVIIESYEGNISSTGPGDLFIVDAVPNGQRGFCVFNNPGARVWMWQFNGEGSQFDSAIVHRNLIVNQVRAMRIFGWKDEGNGQSLDLIAGIVEILGFMNYPGLSTAGQTEFVVRNGAQFSLAGETQISFNGNCYNNLVQETRNGVTKTLAASQNASGFSLPLYCGYDSAAVANNVAVRTPADERPGPAAPSIRIAGRSIVITAATGANGEPPAVDLFSVDGSRMTRSRGLCGRDAPLLERAPAGAYIASIRGNGRSAKRMVIQ